MALISRMKEKSEMKSAVKMIQKVVKMIQKVVKKKKMMKMMKGNRTSCWEERQKVETSESLLISSLSSSLMWVETKIFSAISSYLEPAMAMMMKKMMMIETWKRICEKIGTKTDRLCRR